jgi:MYXO-CTERM domain-containing protein
MKRRFLLAVLVTLVRVPEARACSFDTCPSPVRLVSTRADIPANLIFFKVLVEDPGPLELRMADGTLVPASIRMIGPDRVYAPDAPPAPGQPLTLQFRAVCHSAIPGRPAPPPESRTFEFRVGPAREVALRAPSLKIVETAVSHRGVSAEQSVIVRFRYDSPDRTGNMEHLTDTLFTIDGMGFGSGLDTVVRSYCGQHRSVPDSCGHFSDVPGRPYMLQARTRIVGEREFVDEVPIDTSCAQIAALPDAQAEQPLSGGCGVGGGGPAAGATGLVLLALAALRLRRRYRG